MRPPTIGSLRLAVVRRVAAIGDVGVHGIACLQAEEAAARLRRGVEVRGGQRQPRQAERVGRVGLLRRDHAAARPLVAAVVARERHRAHDAVAVDDAWPTSPGRIRRWLRLRRFERARSAACDGRPLHGLSSSSARAVPALNSRHPAIARPVQE